MTPAGTTTVDTSHITVTVTPSAAAAITDYARRMAHFGAMVVAAVDEHRAAWKANREAVRARRIATVRALAALVRRQLDALFVCEPLAAGTAHAGRSHRLDLEVVPPAPLYVASLVNVPNAPPALVAFTTPMGETT